MELAAFGIALLSSGGVCSSQSLTIGELPPSSDYSFAQNAQNGLVSVLDLGNRASFDGFLQNAAFRWSNAPCQAAVGIGVYRASALFRGHIRLDLIAERGPFDVTSPNETVTFPAPVPVQAGDRIAIRNLTPCGAPTGLGASSSAALVLDGSVFPPEYAPLDQPFSFLPVQVAVKGTGVVNTSVIPVVISSAGQDSSFFRTSLQLYNGGTTSGTGRLIFRRDSQMFRDDSIFLPYALGPGSVLSIPDLLGALGVSGLGSLDVVADSGPSPLGIARIYNDLGVAGTAGFTEDSLNESAALVAGDTAVLLAPPDLVNFRFNIGIRSIDGGSLTATLRDSSGNILSTVTDAFNDQWINQTDATGFVKAPVGPNETIMLEVKSGVVFVYGVTADNRTNDTSFQLAQRVGSY